MNSPGPAVSVIIVNWNTRELLLACLASLAGERSRLDLEVLVVDNASEDASAEAVAAAQPWVRVINNARNRGFAAAVNQGLAEARGAVWMLLNPDTRVRPGAVAVLAARVQDPDGPWAVGPRLVNPDGTLQPSGRRFPTLRGFFLEGLLPAAWRRSAWWRMQVFGRLDFSLPARVDEVSGACLAARREVFERVGPLDERFFLYYEEVDWCRRVTQAGGEVWYAPEAEVVHAWGAASRQRALGALSDHYASALAYWRKHRGIAGVMAARAIILIHGLALFGTACVRGVFPGAGPGRCADAWRAAGRMWRLALGPAPRRAERTC